jgi:hypothetical protein
VSVFQNLAQRSREGVSANIARQMADISPSRSMREAQSEDDRSGCSLIVRTEDPTQTYSDFSAHARLPQNLAQMAAISLDASLLYGSDMPRMGNDDTSSQEASDENSSPDIKSSATSAAEIPVACTANPYPNPRESGRWNVADDVLLLQVVDTNRLIGRILTDDQPLYDWQEVANSVNQQARVSCLISSRHYAAKSIECRITDLLTNALVAAGRPESTHTGLNPYTTTIKEIPADRHLALLTPPTRNDPNPQLISNDIVNGRRQLNWGQGLPPEPFEPPVHLNGPPIPDYRDYRTMGWNNMERQAPQRG